MSTAGVPQPKGGGGGAWWQALLGAGLADRTIGLPFVGSFQDGTDYVPDDGIAMLHEGEAVVPKKANALLQMVSGSSGEEPLSGDFGAPGSWSDPNNYRGGGVSSWARPGDSTLNDLVARGESSWGRPDSSTMDDLVERPGDKALAVAQPLTNRIEDDATTRHNSEITNSTGDSFADQGAGQAQSLRGDIAQYTRSNQQPSRLDTLQQQYDQLNTQMNAPPKKMGMVKSLLLGALAGPRAGEAFRARQQGQEFEENQNRERANSLLQQIENERRMQSEQDRLDQSEAFQERMGERGHEWSLDDPSKVQTIQTEQGTFQRDPRSGQWSPITATGQPIGGAKSQKPDSLEMQYDEALKTGDTNRANQLLNEMKSVGSAKQPPQRPERPQRVLAITPDRQVIEVTPGMKLPPGTQTITGEIKAEQGQEGKNTAVGYANDYLNRGTYTGPGDEALMEKFFEMAKPTSGFRMTEAQQNMLKNAQSWFNSLRAKASHAMGGTYFSDNQRKQIVDTMNELQQSGGGGGSKEIRYKIVNGQLVEQGKPNN